ncbi:MAG: MATE family efflux transporter [Acidaminococcales bacterium]|jgi:putative MATE family efflux protein|nr:MATE family efflux transporter [Acidaminococcales bacterium]
MNLAAYEPSNITKYMVGRILFLSWPVVGEMICLVIGGVLTTAMVGRFGAVEVAAVGLATMLQATCAMVISAAGTGAGALVARAYGARRVDEARRIAGQSLIIAVTASTLAAAFCYNAGRFLIAAASPDRAVVEMANGFLAVMAFFLPFMAVTSVCLASIRATGQTRVSMLVAVAGQLISLSVTYTLLFVLKAGVRYAIAGMASSQALASMISFLAARSSLTLELRWRHIYPLGRDIISNVLKVSSAAGMEQVALQSGRIAFALLMATAGAVQFAGHNVSLQIESISFMPGMAFGIAAMTLVGYNLGRGLTRRARQYAWLTCIIGACVMGCFGVIFYFFAEELTRFFIDDPQVLAWGIGCVRVAAMEQVFLAVDMVLPGVLRGCGDAVTAMYVAVFGTWCFRIPAILLLKQLGWFDVVNGWICAFLDMTIRAVLFIYIVRSKDWRKIKTGIYV